MPIGFLSVQTAGISFQGKNVVKHCKGAGSLQPMHKFLQPVETGAKIPPAGPLRGQWL